jgi:tetratricopeptide (TPR) repeat protein
VHRTGSPIRLALVGWLLAAGLPCVASPAIDVADYWELPVLAKAVLEVGGSEASSRALEIAPSIPAVRYEVARAEGSPLEVVRSVRLLFTNLPSLVWLGTLFGAALGLAVLGSLAVLVLLGFARTIEIHGHQIGHLSFDRTPPAWPGALLVASGLALLPLAGIGPALVLALAGALTALRMPRAQGVRIGIGLIVACVVLGPALDLWSRLATLPGRDPAAYAAWRIERQQPLPGDHRRLEIALSTRPDDAALRLVSATAWKRAGDLARAEAVLAKLPAELPLDLEARRQNLTGILLLARGEVRQAAEAFESASAAEESAAVLYNLSQAHGRALRLIEQGNLFAAARELDPQLVSLYTAFQGANVHTYLIQAPLPLATYLGWALSPSLEAGRLAREVRDRLLGPAMHGFGWQLIGVLGLVSLLFRHAGIRRCTRCLRLVCLQCSPELSSTAQNCSRCANLFSQSESIDSRMRSRQIVRDRRRVRGMARALAALGLIVPGAARIIEGRVGAGWLQLVLAICGLSLLVTRSVAALPAEVGELGATLPGGAALLLLVPTYLLAANESRRRLQAARRPS